MIEVWAGNTMSKSFSTQRLFDVLSNKDTVIDIIDSVESNPKESAERLIAWLPNIKELGAYRYFDYSFIDVRFTNDESVRLYNTGYELALWELVEETES